MMSGRSVGKVLFFIAFLAVTPFILFAALPIDARTIKSAGISIRYSVQARECPEAPGTYSGCDLQPGEISCGKKIIFQDHSSNEWKVITKVPDFSSIGVCTHVDSFYVVGASGDLFAIRNDTLLRLFGETICGVKIPQKLMLARNVNPFELKHFFCVDNGLVLNNTLYTKAKKRRLFPQGENAIAKWRSGKTYRILGDRGTLLKVGSGKISRIGRRKLPPLSTFDIIYGDSYAGHSSRPNHCYIYGYPTNSSGSNSKLQYDIFRPESDSGSTGRFGCFYWGSESQWVYCPRTDGLDSFSRTPDSIWISLHRTVR